MTIVESEELSQNRLEEQCQMTALPEKNVKISEAALRYNVSVATVRNWIKEGFLVSEAKGFVSVESLQAFDKEFIGKRKLISRANKIHKENLNDLSDYVQSERSKNIPSKKLAEDYESMLSESYKNKEGIFYTPENIVGDLMSDLGGDVSEKTFLEPCCGCGNFIVEALKKGFKPDNIYAFDTDINAVNITKLRVYEYCGYNSPNIVCVNFLESYNALPLKFDYIFTNPPWGKKIPKRQKDSYARRLQAGFSNDTSSLFLFACLQILKHGGKLGLLLPEAFFNIAAFENARIKTLSTTINRLIDYGKPFKGLITKAQAIVLTNAAPDVDTRVSCEFGRESHYRKQFGFLKNPKNIFNFWCDEQTSKIIDHLYSLPHITLKDNAQWGLGIVTGNNSELCQLEPNGHNSPIFRGKDITPLGLSKATLYIDENALQKCQQVAPMNLYKAKEKIVYRFVSNRLVFCCDTQQRLILNSANFLILKQGFPLSGKQLSDLLNSDLMNWLFHNVFRTHKVIRSDLEQLPIYANYFLANGTFSESSFLDFLNVENYNGSYKIKEIVKSLESNV